MALSDYEKERRLAERRLNKWNNSHKIIGGIDNKKCNKCNEFKPATLENFYANKANGIDGLYPYCIACAKLDAKTFQEKNRDKKSEYNKRHNSKTDRRERNKVHKKNYRDKGGQLNWQRNNTDKLEIYRESHRDHEITEGQWLKCKEYFHNSCAYCGLHISEHFNTYAGELKWTDLHKEHVDHEGSNDLSNCVPACKSCNCQKWASSFSEWYNSFNDHFCIERMTKIQQWLEVDHKKFL